MRQEFLDAVTGRESCCPGGQDFPVATCLALIESEGIGAVSLRRVAREAGGGPVHPSKRSAR